MYLSLSYYPPEHAAFTGNMQEDNKSNSNLNNIMKNLCPAGTFRVDF